RCTSNRPGGTPRRAAGRRPATRPSSACPSMDLYTFLIQLLNGVQYGLLLFLVASGLTLIFGIMGIINLAHGSFYMIGAYMAFTLASLTGSLFIAIVVGIVLSVLLGIVLEWALFSHLYKRDHLEQVLLSYGLI